MSITTPTIISAAVDYLTVTTRNTDYTEYLLGEGHRFMQQEIRNGATEEKSGFQGYAGRQAGAVFWGFRADGAILRVSGPAAQGVAELLDWERVKATRIDVQVTVALPEYDPGVALRLHQRNVERRRKGDARVPPSPLYNGREGEGDEYKIGVRSSPRYGRLYDKWKESGDEAYRNAWRWECEFKKMVAPEVVATLASNGWSASACIAIVSTQFGAWHCAPIFRGDALAAKGSKGRRDADAERVLTWLARQVAPAIEKLRAAGYEDAALEALGWKRG